jgi:hypothetical protein
MQYADLEPSVNDSEQEPLHPLVGVAFEKQRLVSVNKYRKP